MVRPTKFEIRERTDGTKVTLALHGDLDMRTLGKLSDRLSEHVTQGATDVIVDLRALTFLDSSGLRLLIQLHDRSRQEGWKLRLVHPEQEGAALVLRLTAADQNLPFIPAKDA